MHTTNEGYQRNYVSNATVRRKLPDFMAQCITVLPKFATQTKDDFIFIGYAS